MKMYGLVADFKNHEIPQETEAFLRHRLTQINTDLKVQIITYRLKSVQSEREEFPSFDA